MSQSIGNAEVHTPHEEAGHDQSVERKEPKCHHEGEIRHPHVSFPSGGIGGLLGPEHKWPSKNREDKETNSKHERQGKDSQALNKYSQKDKPLGRVHSEGVLTKSELGESKTKPRSGKGGSALYCPLNVKLVLRNEADEQSKMSCRSRTRVAILFFGYKSRPKQNYVLPEEHQDTDQNFHEQDYVLA